MSNRHMKNILRISSHQGNAKKTMKFYLTPDSMAIISTSERINASKNVVLKKVLSFIFGVTIN